tara:strand:- start:448 stop:582 length:135 start_codon:yes stop_codon:yes gene_type:complete
MSQTLQILNRMIEEIDLALIKAKAQLEYSADEAMIKLGMEENEE